MYFGILSPSPALSCRRRQQLRALDPAALSVANSEPHHVAVAVVRSYPLSVAIAIADGHGVGDTDAIYDVDSGIDAHASIDCIEDAECIVDTQPRRLSWRQRIEHRHAGYDVKHYGVAGWLVIADGQSDVDPVADSKHQRESLGEPDAFAACLAEPVVDAVRVVDRQRHRLAVTEPVTLR